MKPLLQALLQGLGWLLIVIGGLSFLVGGRAISEFGKVDRILAEMWGLGIAGACLALGYILKSAGEPDELIEDEDSSPENPSVRK